MPEMLYGGAAHFLGYRIKINATEDGYDIVQADGTTAATTTAHASLILNGYIEQSQYIPASDGTMKVTLDNYDVAVEIIDFLNVFAKKPSSAAGTAPAAIIMENGISRGGVAGSSSVPNILWLGAGPLDGAGTNRLAHWGVGTTDLSSGPIVYKDGQWIKPVIIINSMASEFTLAIPSGLWPTAYFGTVGSLSVPQYEHYMRDYLDAPGP